ncbi:MAG: NAD-dependent epimerase/dehydratase family protein [Dehalococcoidia bacterium]
MIAGASGVVGQAAIRHFAHSLDWDVVGVSRRPPLTDQSGVTYVPVDLLDRQHCNEVFGRMTDVTHLVWAAVNENPADLRAGWRDPEQMQKNLRMLENLFEPLLAAADNFQHVSLLQGTKAYGVHAGMRPSIPLREDSPRQIHDNFYFLQEDYVRSQQAGQPWYWTILRPVLIFGDAVGSNLNALLAIAIYGALRKEVGLPLPYPSGGRQITECVDSDLQARALMWSATSLASRNEIFNVANGDHVTMYDLWPVFAEALGMEIGPPNRGHWRRKCVTTLAHGRAWCATTIWPRRTT